MDAPIQSGLVAGLHFLARDPKYDIFKPYTVRYDPQGKFPYTNIDNVKHDVELLNLRRILENSPENISWERQGFQIVHLPDRMKYEDFNNDDTIRALHIPHILTTLQNKLQAEEIHVLDYRIRKRDAEFPIRAREEYQYLQPSSRVHIDYTKDAIQDTIRGFCGEEASTILERPWQAINVWHPLRGPCVDWPLAICDASTVNFSSDTIASDFVDTWGYSENKQVHFSATQKWYYLEKQMPNELLVFKSADSRDGEEGVPPGTPHASFNNPYSSPADLPRESLEIRMLATY